MKCTCGAETVIADIGLVPTYFCKACFKAVCAVGCEPVIRKSRTTQKGGDSDDEVHVQPGRAGESLPDTRRSDARGGGVGASSALEDGVLILPYPPRTNTYYRMVMVKGFPRMLISAGGRAYKKECGNTARSQGARPLKGSLAVKLDFYRPRKVGDLDGRLKALFDALNGIAWEDDSQVADIHARRFEDKQNPRVEVSINQIEAAVGGE